MNRFAEIETYVAVVEGGSLSRAASRLRIAVSAVSRRIGELEARLGVALTHRSSRGVTPTAEGKSYYTRCLRIIADLAEADAIASGQDGRGLGTIRLTSPHAFGVRYLAPIVNAYAVANPDIRLGLEISDRTIDLIAEGFDLAVRIGRTNDPALLAQPLFTVRYIVSASPVFWQRYGRPKRPEDLSGLPALVYPVGQNPGCWRFTGPDRKHTQVWLEPRLTANSGEFLIEAAKAGLGVSLEPSFVCADAIRDGSLEPVLMQYTTHHRVAELIRPQSRPLSLRVQAFTDVLQEHFTDPTPWDRDLGFG